METGNLLFTQISLCKSIHSTQNTWFNTWVWNSTKIIVSISKHRKNRLLSVNTKASDKNKFFCSLPCFLFNLCLGRQENTFLPLNQFNHQFYQFSRTTITLYCCEGNGYTSWHTHVRCSRWMWFGRCVLYKVLFFGGFYCINLKLNLFEFQIENPLVEKRPFFQSIFPTNLGKLYVKFIKASAYHIKSFYYNFGFAVNLHKFPRNLPKPSEIFKFLF